MPACHPRATATATARLSVMFTLPSARKKMQITITFTGLLGHHAAKSPCQTWHLIRRAECQRRCPLRDGVTEGRCNNAQAASCTAGEHVFVSVHHHTIISKQSDAIHSVIHSHHRSLGNDFNGEPWRENSASKRIEQLRRTQTWMHLLKLRFDHSVWFPLKLSELCAVNFLYQAAFLA